MTTDKKNRDEKLQHNIKETAKISGLSSGKIDKYEYFVDEEILSSSPIQIIQQAKFNYSPLERALEKQTKTMSDQGDKKIKAVEKQKQIMANEGNGEIFKKD